MANQDYDMWTHIFRNCERLSIKDYSILGQLANRNVLVTIPIEDQCWLIGPYNTLTSVGSALRSDVNLQLEFQSVGIRLGDRRTDSAPTGPWRRRIGDRGSAQSTQDYTNQRLNHSRPTTRPIGSARQTNRFAADAAFWAGRTPEAHHIIEDNIVEAMHQAFGVLKHDYAPCVLLFAELHQRWINRVANQHRPKFNASMTKNTANTNLDLYIRDLYSSPAGRPIGPIAKVIRDVIVARLPQ